MGRSFWPRHGFAQKRRGESVGRRRQSRYRHGRGRRRPARLQCHALPLRRILQGPRPCRLGLSRALQSRPRHDRRLQSGPEAHAHANRDGRRQPLRLPLHQENLNVGTGKTMHSIRRCVIAAIFVLGGIATAAHAQDYPTRPVRFISDSAPGSAIDVTMRVIVDGISRVWGGNAVLINQPGAGGAIGVRAVSSATPDGYTFGMFALSDFVTLPGTADNLPVQVPHDFTPVGSLGGAPMFITAAPWLEVKTLPDLIALAKQRPGELAYGTNGPGRLTHLTGELLQSRAGIKLLMVPYSGGTPQVLNDMMGKRVALAFDSYSGIAGAVEAKNAIPLAVAAPRRMTMFPDLPTVAETLPGFQSAGWQMLVAPVGTPDAIVKKVNAVLIKALALDDVKKRLTALGRDDLPLSPAETLAFIQHEQATWAPILAQIGPVK